MSAPVLQETVNPDAGRPLAAERRPPTRLALAPARGQELTGILGELAKLYLLDVNGTSLLTRRAAMEMKLITVMLTINFFFDLAVWTLLWNMIFYAGKMTVGFLSFIAVFCGFLFAAIIFVYERQFMTADTYRRWRKVWWPVSLRLCVIAVAAGVTTQPFEVLVFNGPIQRRTHEESVRQEGLRQLRSLEEKKKALAGGLKETVEGHNAADAQDRSDKASAQTNRYRADADVARAALASAEASIRNAQQQRNRAQTQQQAIAANRRLAAAQTRRERAVNELSEAEGNIASSEKDEQQRTAQFKEAFQGLVGKQTEAEEDVKRLQDWIKQIGRANPGEPVVENTAEPIKWQFSDTDYDFFQRLGVINDLYFGRPPRWFDASAEDRKKLGAVFNLTDADESDALIQQRRDADAHTFAWAYWAVIFIAAVIPLLLLALKGLLPIDLKHYYSLASQQKAGNYESLQFQMAGGLSAIYGKGNEGVNGRQDRSSRRDEPE